MFTVVQSSWVSAEMYFRYVFYILHHVDEEFFIKYTYTMFSLNKELNFSKLMSNYIYTE